jgi:uncharacterized membrane protein
MDGVPSSPAVPPPAETPCPRCGATMPATAAFCPGCGRSMKPLSPGERLAAAFGYCTLVPAVVLLFLPAYRKSQFVRFHVWQSVLLWGVFILASAIAIIFSNFLDAIVLLLAGVLASLAMFFLWVVLIVKAGQGERFELPFFGGLAGRLR